jgi:Flp pilus assembly protein CpaB
MLAKEIAMPKNNRLIIIGAAVLGVLALLSTLMLMRGGGSSPSPTTDATAAAAPITTQLVAARDIPPRTVITRDMVNEEETDTPDPAALKTRNDLQAGRIASTTIRRGDPITASLLTNTLGRVVPANFEVPPTLRAVAIWVDPNQTAAGLVDVGDRVDVITTHKNALSPQSTERFEEVFTGTKEGVTASTIAQDLLVLAVDKSIQAAITVTPTPAPGAAPGAAAPPPPPPPTPAANQVVRTRVVLAATPEVAQRLVAANESGVMHVTIRNPNVRAQFPIVARREAPGSIQRIAKRSKDAGSGGGSVGGGGATSRGNDAPMPSITSPFLGPMQPSGPSTSGMGMSPAGGMSLPPASGMTPPAPSGSEVTVIRGTEKTRVLVPGR